ncbi:trypsin-like peptidase domain-containing protein [bacterium]|nr:MAG: trypsin-like peptidase domain-containing protein [bacterium]QQR61726.1 MAG: trypsin-like peptidase domain-containing protein [bacterium]QQR62706.1 MAG: trypsin-like peptidase domain-containing protein [bacterium]
MTGNTSSIQRNGIIFLFVYSIVLSGFLYYKLYYLETTIHSVHIKTENLKQDLVKQEQSEPERKLAGVVQQMVVTSSQLWKPVQDMVKDTVVQIFSQIAAIDILQPYKTPSQGAAYGSGFFINADGDLITNAHVVTQAKAVWIQIPSLGKRIIDVDIVGISPERDLALLRLTEESKKMINEALGAIPFLPLGDSDKVFRSDDVLALGYPLGQQSLKSTTGVISGHERHYIQMSAPINPGSSGGPLLNSKGEVIGINSAGIMEAQNVGYAIPINDLKLVLSELYTTPLLRKPFLGVFFNNGSVELTEYLGNPLPGGCYVVGVLPGSTLDKAGVQRGDMIYEINGHPIDLFGEMKVPWSEDKLSIIDFVGRLPVGQELKLVLYRKGKRMELAVQFNMAVQPAVRKIYPGYDEIDYEIFGGMVVMPLTLNHVHTLIEAAPGLADFADFKQQANAALVVTHVFPNSVVYRTRTITVGSTLVEVNGIAVSTLAELRAALKKGMTNKFLTITSKDNGTRMADPIFVVLEYQKMLSQEKKFASDYRYPLSTTMKELLATFEKRQAFAGAFAQSSKLVKT